MKYFFAIALVLPNLAFASITVSKQAVREAPPSSTMTAAYMELHNQGKKTDFLESVSSPDAKIEMHITTMEDGMMSMEEVKALEVPAKGKLIFKPGGTHLMLRNLKRVLKAGQKIEMKLMFRSGKTLSLSVPVKAL